MAENDRTILVVDDDEDFRTQLRVQLEAAGYAVREAEGTQSAEAALEAAQPDLVIVDLMMDQPDAGFNLCYRIKRQTPELPVIMVTAVTSETGLKFGATTDEERAWVKADAVLDKPVRFEQLKRQMDRLLKG